MLTFAQKRGNATFYEWRTGKVPTVIERPIVEEAPPDAVTEDTVGFTVVILCIIQFHILENFLSYFSLEEKSLPNL